MQPLTNISLLFTLLFMDALVAQDQPQTPKPSYWIGYTEHRNDLPEGQFANWRTSRAWLVQADGQGRRELASELKKDENTWTQFAGWSPDGKIALIAAHWESPENAAWERKHQAFRMTEGWLSDTYLLNLESGQLTNVTEVDRVSNYNSAGFTPDGQRLLMTSLIDGVSKPFMMELDGRGKKDISGGGTGFTYGLNSSPDGMQICYHEGYQVFVANADGSHKRRIETGHPFNFAPQWSPDGQWILFVSGEHYNCHPHVVDKDGQRLTKLADRGGYAGVVEFLQFPDFHSARSDVPTWSRDGKSVYFTAKVEDRIELMRVDLHNHVTRLTRSGRGTRHYHPSESPDGEWLLFGSDKSGVMQLYVADKGVGASWPITNVPAGFCTLAGGWQPPTDFQVGRDQK